MKRLHRTTMQPRDSIEVRTDFRCARGPGCSRNKPQ